MKNATLIIGVLLVGVVLFGCTSVGSQPNYIGCWTRTDGTDTYRLDSDGSGAFGLTQITWTSVGSNQIRTLMPTGTGGNLVEYLTYQNTNGMETISKQGYTTGGRMTLTYIRSHSC